MNFSSTPLCPIVSAAEMQAIESRIFDGGMPVAALMEKVGLRLTEAIAELFPITNGYDTISVLVGPGHNGGDALVVARELWERGHRVKLLRPITTAKSLTESHAAYAQHLGILSTERSDWFQTDVIIDGLFGFGLSRPIEGDLSELIDQINQSGIPVVSIDVPSGLHTDTGECLGTAIMATHTFCLGLWKRAFFQEMALTWIGTAHLLPFGIPLSDQEAILGTCPANQLISWAQVQTILGRERPAAVHKYDMGATLLICGSSQYPGAAILAAKAAQATGVGMLYVAVPHSLQTLVVAQVPDAIVIACAETSNGAIAALPPDFSLKKITSVAIGPGLTHHASSVVVQCLAWDLPVVLDADALNILGSFDWRPVINRRTSPTILTPHWGEFKRLFPEIETMDPPEYSDRITLLPKLGETLRATLILKGAKTLVAAPEPPLLINPHSTPALARGGSGDVLTGMLAGLLAQAIDVEPRAIAAAAVWWHAHAAIHAAHTHTQAGVSPIVLIESLVSYRRSLEHGTEKNKI